MVSQLGMPPSGRACRDIHTDARMHKWTNNPKTILWWPHLLDGKMHKSNYQSYKTSLKQQHRRVQFDIFNTEHGTYMSEHGCYEQRRSWAVTNYDCNRPKPRRSHRHEMPRCLCSSPSQLSSLSVRHSVLTNGNTVQQAAISHNLLQ